VGDGDRLCAGHDLSPAGGLTALREMPPWLIRGSTCGQMRAKLRPGF
jgi:hypothetical protein